MPKNDREVFEGYAAGINAWIKEIRKNPDKLKPKWFKVFKYNMGTVENAFSVYSQQYRHNGRPLDWAQFAYAVSNAIFFVHGQDYFEMRAAGTSEALNTSMQAMAKEYLASNAIEDATPAGFSWLPRKDLDVKSVTMVVSNAFAFERLDQVFTGEYRIDDMTGRRG